MPLTGGSVGADGIMSALVYFSADSSVGIFPYYFTIEVPSFEKENREEVRNTIKKFYTELDGEFIPSYVQFSDEKDYFKDGGSVGSDGMTAMQILRHEKSNLVEENLILKQLLKNGFFYVNYGGTDCDGCSSENHRKFTSLDEFNKWRYNDNDAEGSFYASVVREGEPLNEDVSGGYWGMAKGGSLNKKIMFGWF